MPLTTYIKGVILKGGYMWDVEYSDEFGEWWESLNEGEQVEVAAVVGMLEECGPNLCYPYSSSIIGSKVEHLRELRVQHKGKPHRVLYAFDPRRVAILLLGGNKTGKNRWYETFASFANNTRGGAYRWLRNLETCAKKCLQVRREKLRKKLKHFLKKWRFKNCDKLWI